MSKSGVGKLPLAVSPLLQVSDELLGGVTRSVVTEWASPKASAVTVRLYVVPGLRPSTVRVSIILVESRKEPMEKLANGTPPADSMIDPEKPGEGEYRIV